MLDQINHFTQNQYVCASMCICMCMCLFRQTLSKLHKTGWLLVSIYICGLMNLLCYNWNVCIWIRDEYTHLLKQMKYITWRVKLSLLSLDSQTFILRSGHIPLAPSSLIHRPLVSDLHHQLVSLVLKPLDLDIIKPSAFLALQLADRDHHNIISLHNNVSQFL